MRVLLVSACLAGALATAGCSSIGSVNGVRMGATDAPDATYCDKNPAVCIVAGVAVVGGIAYAIHEARDDDDNTPAPAKEAEPAPDATPVLVAPRLSGSGA